jgi:predicted unusual protein kinase regulating ubiquinone biosynthesis (AarF/ABC1/UbiB family)
MIESVAYKPPRWQRTRLLPLVRQMDIATSSMQLAFYLWWDHTVMRQPERTRHRRAQWLVGTLLDLGPTFIKLGQALSTRADLLPLEYVEALGQLQDRVPAFDPDQAIATVEAELGASIYALYRQFDPLPIAAASLGQVHKAKLHSGQEVVVKVQRPGLERLFALDLKALQRLVGFCERWLPWTRRYNLKAIFQEFSDILYQEIDYIREALNADRFRYNFRQHPRIVIPGIYPKHTTRRVLTMDYVPGIKISDRQSLEACEINVKEINQLGICCYLKQLLQDGFFQADPHPGNMAVSQEGNLIFYDFGMMAEVRPIDKDQMIRTFFAVLRKDTDEVVDTLTVMGLIERVDDMTPVRRVTRFLLEQFTERPVELREFTQLRSELYALFEQQPFRLPAKMTFILKALTTLDGVARTLDPQYNLMSAAKPFVATLATNGQGRGMGELARQARAYVAYKLRQPSATNEKMRQLEDRLEQIQVQNKLQMLERDRQLKTLRLTVRWLIYTGLAGLLGLAGGLAGLAGLAQWAIAGFVLATLFAIPALRYLVKLVLQRRLNRLAITPSSQTAHP